VKITLTDRNYIYEEKKVRLLLDNIVLSSSELCLFARNISFKFAYSFL
jgi:hypothetical protein